MSEFRYNVATHEEVPVGQLRSGDTVFLNGTNNPGLTIRSIRDGMVSGIGFRTTEGEYVKFPHGMAVTRQVRA